MLEGDLARHEADPYWRNPCAIVHLRLNRPAWPGTKRIALLDSDDRWCFNHLSRLLAALRAGHEFCFADVRRNAAAAHG